MNKKLKFFLLAFFSFLLFVLFSYFVNKGHFTQIDFNTTVRLQDHIITHRFDTLFSIFSLVGSAEVVSLILLAILIIYRKLGLLIALPAFAAFHIIELFGKVFVNHPGPPYLFFRYDIPFMFPTAYVQPGSSYPSGHAARAAFISVILILLTARSKKITANKKLIIYAAIFVFDITMFVSRIYLGEHWTSDVIGGAILGFSFGVASIIFI